MSRPPFVHLHVHTNFSFGDGACRIHELVRAAAEAGMPAAAITDHDGLYGAVRFYQACRKAGVKPIVGVELNVEGVEDHERRLQDGTLAAPQTQISVGEALKLAQHSWSRRTAGETWPEEPDTGAAEAEKGTGRPSRAAPGARGRAQQHGVGAQGRRAAERPRYDGPLRGQTAAPGYHLLLLAEDHEGWSNLCRIISAAHLERPGEPPLARWQTVAEHAGHLIALSACRRGELGRAVLQSMRGVKGARERARRIAARYAEVFNGLPEGSISGAAMSGPEEDRAGGMAGGALAGGSAVRHAADPAVRLTADPATARFFIELQQELLPDSHEYVRQLNLIAHELRLPTVATNNVHYLTQAEAPLHDVLAAEAANQPLPNPLGRMNAELYFKTAGQMQRLFFHIPEAIENTGRIAARCTLDLGLGKLLFPAYPLPPGETAYSLLCKRCFAGAAERYRPVTPEVTRRLEHELKVIGELGFAEYFLAVADIVAFAAARAIPYSGRGSAGNSIVSYVLRICDADPIEHDLLFERFLNPARREMPDVDIDFCSERRDEVIEYIYERFGHDKVAMVATVNTMHAPSAVRVVAKAFGYRPDEVDRLSRKVPWGNAARLSEMLAERPELVDHEFQHPHYARLVRMAERLADFPAHLGTHLGGFILARERLTDRVPLQWAAKGVIVAQFDKDDIETLGLVKMDILGLKMHSAIAEAVRRIEERTGVRISPWELPRDDPKVYELISSAQTVGVFQLESAGQRNLATRLRERDFEDVTAAISLFRPGPLQAEMIGPFIRRRHGREAAAVLHNAMWPALKSTYGVIVYQEQVIAVASAVAGFSLSEADMLRRAMTHDRSMEEMDQIGRTFVERAVANGVEQPVAEEVFRQLRGFAAYGFNKAHAACFAIVCNASAWLKTHYPAEFYCGLMNNQPMGFYSPRVLLNDARRRGLEVRPPDINRSEEGFSVEAGAQALRVGLKYVKDMSVSALRRIVAERGQVPRDAVGRPIGEPAEEGRPYTSLADFVERTRTSVEISENLVRAGAFDALGTRREELLAQLPLLYAGRDRRTPSDARMPRAGGHGAAQTGTAAFPAGRRPSRGAAGPAAQSASDSGEALRLMTDELPPLGFLPDWTLQERVRAELEVLGLNVSAHPLAFLREQIRALKVTDLARLPQVPHGRRVRLAGVLERAQMPWIRSGHRTLFLTLEDETELAQVVVFNDVYLRYGAIFKDAPYLYVEGVLQNDEEHGLAVVAERILDLLEVVQDGGGRRAPGARRPPRCAAGRQQGEPRGGGKRQGRSSALHDPDRRPASDPDCTPPPFGKEPDNRYPFAGPAPEDTRLGAPKRRLDLPDMRPRTRPGRTG